MSTGLDKETAKRLLVVVQEEGFVLGDWMEAYKKRGAIIEYCQQHGMCEDVGHWRWYERDYSLQGIFGLSWVIYCEKHRIAWLRGVPLSIWEKMGWKWPY